MMVGDGAVTFIETSCADLQFVAFSLGAERHVPAR